VECRITNILRLPLRPLILSPSSSLGGAERVLLDLISPWKIEVPKKQPQIVCIEDGPLIKKLITNGFLPNLKKFPEKLLKLGDSPARLENRLSRSVRLGLALPALASTVFLWRRWLFRDTPAWIHSNGFKTHILAAWSAPKTVDIYWHLHDFVGDRPLMRKLLNRAWRPGIQALAISNAVANDFTRHIPKCPVHVWQNTIDTNVFKPGVQDGNWLDKAAGFTPDWQGVRVGMVATYARWKGHDVFMKAATLAAKQCKVPVRFFLIGGPVYQTAGSQWTENQLRKMIGENNLDSVVGLIPFQKDTVQVYRSLDVVVHASIRPEPFGLVIGEAMACGKAVVAALHGGAAEIGEHGLHCLGHIPGDADSLACAMQKFIEDADLRQTLGNAGKLRINTFFGPEQIKPRWEKLLGDMV
jgi:glycosyltransferase involved in cell wall biosynthesis